MHLAIVNGYGAGTHDIQTVGLFTKVLQHAVLAQGLALEALSQIVEHVVLEVFECRRRLLKQLMDG